MEYFSDMPKNGHPVETIEEIGTGDMERKKQMALDVWSERVAQNLLDNPSMSLEILCEFERELREYYAEMMIHDVDRATNLIARHLRKAAMAATTTLTYSGVLRQLVPILESGRSLIVNENDTFLERIYPLIDLGLPTSLSGSAAYFFNNMSAHLARGIYTTLDQISSPDGYFFDVWECFDAAQSLWCSTARVKFPGDHLASSRGFHLVTVDDTTIVTLELLVNFAHSYSHTNQYLPTNDELVAASLKNADVFTWAAGVNRNIARPLLHEDRLMERLGDIEGCNLEDYSQVFPERKPMFQLLDDPGYYTFNHPSLAEGPWRRSGTCPAVPMLRSPDPGDHELTERFFRTIEDRFGVPIMRGEGEDMKGYTSRATLAVLIGILVAHETIFAAWPKGPDQDKGASSHNG